jgi:hypothetical protein
VAETNRTAKILLLLILGLVLAGYIFTHPSLDTCTQLRYDQYMKSHLNPWDKARLDWCE